MSELIWCLLATGTPCGTHSKYSKTIKVHGKNNYNASTVPSYAVEAT